MGLTSRRKGRAFEQHIARVLRERFPGHAELIHRASQADRAYMPDVTGHPLPLWLECTHGARLDLLGKLSQAERDTGIDGKGLVPVVVWRKNGGPDCIAMGLEAFLDLLAPKIEKPPG